MKYLISLLLVAASTQAFAGGIAFMDSPTSDGNRIVVLLSNMQKSADECDGMQGASLGSVSIKTSYGEELSSHKGCWKFITGKDVIRIVVFAGESSKQFEFHTSNFILL